MASQSNEHLWSSSRCVSGRLVFSFLFFLKKTFSALPNKLNAWFDKQGLIREQCLGIHCVKIKKVLELSKTKLELKHRVNTYNLGLFLLSIFSWDY